MPIHPRGHVLRRSFESKFDAARKNCEAIRPSRVSVYSGIVCRGPESGEPEAVVYRWGMQRRKLSSLVIMREAPARAFTKWEGRNNRSPSASRDLRCRTVMDGFDDRAQRRYRFTICMHAISNPASHARVKSSRALLSSFAMPVPVE